MNSFISDRRGSIAVTFAMASVVLIVAMGGAVDYAIAARAKSLLQDALDSGTLSAVILTSNNYFAPTPEAERRAEAERVFGANYSGVPATTTFTFVGDTVRGTATAEVPTAFLGIIGINVLRVGATSAAARSIGPPICMLSLSLTAEHGIEIQGTTQLHAVNCAVHANSNSRDALLADGGGTGQALGFCARGGFAGENWTPEPRTNCNYVPDPFEGLAVPSGGTCRQQNDRYQNGTYYLEPGVYCGGITARANAHLVLAPGVYVMKDGPLTLMAQSTFSGDGVTVYFTGAGAVLDHRSGAAIDITAPTTGDYAGIAFAQNPDASEGLVSTLAGGPDIRIVGSLYYPTQTLDLRGGADYSALSPYMPMVADRFIIRGNAELKVEVDLTAAENAGYDNALAHDLDRARLIE